MDAAVAHHLVSLVHHYLHAAGQVPDRHLARHIAHGIGTIIRGPSIHSGYGASSWKHWVDLVIIIVISVVIAVALAWRFRRRP